MLLLAPFGRSTVLVQEQASFWRKNEKVVVILIPAFARNVGVVAETSYEKCYRFCHFTTGRGFNLLQ